nr:MAG TPA: hypothetical protein [Bacteriophage sp.]DAH34360.1 MAG TPA: hypothetical protein [Caudoviricetes sp.]
MLKVTIQVNKALNKTILNIIVLTSVILYSTITVHC